MNKLEYDKSISEGKIKMEKGYLTRSEREALKKMIDNPKDYIKEDAPAVVKNNLPIVTNRIELKHQCEKIVKGEDVKGIIQALKDTLKWQPNAIGLSAPQIGIKKCVCFISIPSINKEKNSIEYHEKVLVNPVIIEKSTPIQVKGEGCCSFPGIRVDTKRYVYCTVEYLDENLKPQIGSVQDLESFAISHECDHLNGILIFDRKWKTK
jgi:peptide deformylase